MKYPNIFTLLFFAAINLHGQNFNHNEFKDSISDLSILSLDELSMEFHRKLDTLRGVFVSNKLIEKSRKAVDHEYESRAYHTLYLLEKDLNIKLQYADSMLFAAKESKNKIEITNAYYSLANSNYFLGNYAKSMESLAKSYKLALEINNERKLLAIETRMAALKNTLGRHLEAKNIYINAFKKYENTSFNEIDNKRKYLTLVYNISKSYSDLKEYDSVIYYANKGLFNLQYFQSEYHKERFLMIKGAGLLGNKVYDDAIKLIEIPKYSLSPRDRSERLFKLGEAYRGKNDNTKAILNYLKSDSAQVKSSSGLIPEYKFMYKWLYIYYRNNNDTINASKFLDKYFITDSLLSKRNNSIGEKMHILYDLPRLKSEQQKVNRHRNILYSIIGLLLTIVSITFLLLNRNKNEINRQKKIVNDYLVNDISLTSDPVKERAVQSSKGYITEETRVMIIQMLERFKLNKGYLDSGITQNKLAKQINTNHTNLYKVLKNDIGISFPNYIKRLRIENAVTSLSNEPKYLNYTIEALSEQFGFTNADTFSRTFREITSVKPSIFIGELKKVHKITDNL